MAPNLIKRLNKQYLLQSCCLNRVSKRTKQRWKLLQHQSSEYSASREITQNITVNLAETIDTSECVMSNNEFLSSSNKSAILNHFGNENIEFMEANDFDNVYNDNSDGSSSDDSDSSDSSDSENFSAEDEDFSSDDHDSESSSENDMNCKSNNEFSGSYSDKSKTFNTDHMQGKTMMFSKAQLTVADVLLMVTVYSIKHRSTKREEDDLIGLIKILAGPEFSSWNPSHHARAKAYNPPKSKINTHFFCTNCNIILTSHNNSQKMKKKSIKCTTCEAKYKLTLESTNQFVTIDFQYQLESLLHEKEIQEDLLKTFTKLDERENDGIINDIYDSKFYKDIQQLSPQTLTFNLNTDGAPAFNSSNRSFWPIQLILNELSPQIRKQNVILAGMMLTSTEPSPQLMNSYLSKFLDDAEKLMTNGLNITMHDSNLQRNFKVHCHLVCVDSVARLNHILEVESVQGDEIFENIDCFESKLIFYTTGIKNYVSSLPDHLGN
ncbi:uncharacterized protein LOC123274110 isoform X3 [Cotesia glomerata]|uniref:uncharacterized protein LOC123274110 isoform X3 n=1 Tax=Cotesia glomerata TaxID=32391 RepID=UPI001D034F61|nr:uncharacterized protein LOC123274110 isoform X3 [Cotesia glomerata]